MKNEYIGKMLRHNRKLNKLSVKEVSDLLCENHSPVATKTIYGWESGHTQPDADTLLYLCDLYKIDNILETFGYESTPKPPLPQLTDFEYEVIKKYRQHPEMHEVIHKLIGIIE